MRPEKLISAVFSNRWRLVAGVLLWLGLWACLNPETDDFPTADGSGGSTDSTGNAPLPGAGQGGSGAFWDGSAGSSGNAGSNGTPGAAGGGDAGAAGSGGLEAPPDGGVLDAGVVDAGAGSDGG